MIQHDCFQTVQRKQRGRHGCEYREKEKSTRFAMQKVDELHPGTSHCCLDLARAIIVTEALQRTANGGYGGTVGDLELAACGQCSVGFYPRSQ